MTKTTTKEIVSGFNVIELSIQPLYEPELAENRRLLPTGQSAGSASPILWRAGRREGETRETMAYSVLCFCGLWTIGLCLL